MLEWLTDCFKQNTMLLILAIMRPWKLTGLKLQNYIELSDGANQYQINPQKSQLRTHNRDSVKCIEACFNSCCSSSPQSCRSTPETYSSVSLWSSVLVLSFISDTASCTVPRTVCFTLLPQTSVYALVLVQTSTLIFYSDVRVMSHSVYLLLAAASIDTSL